MEPRAAPGRVTELLTKPHPHEEATSHIELSAIAERGLVGDCHAQPLGPRQILVVRQETLDELGVGARQVRANLALAGLRDDDLESGCVLRVASKVRIRITHSCEICKALRNYVDQETYRRLVGRRGSLGVLLSGGNMRLGDTVIVENRRFPAVPEGMAERVAWIVARIPFGQVLMYDTLLTLAGAKRAHFRVLPTYLKRAHGVGLPVHRVLTSAGSLTGHVPDQRQSLAHEGVATHADGVLVDYRLAWLGPRIFLDA